MKKKLNSVFRTVLSLVLVGTGAAMIVPSIITVFQDLPTYYLIIISTVLISMGTMIRLTTIDIKKKGRKK